MIWADEMPMDTAGQIRLQTMLTNFSAWGRCRLQWRPRRAKGRSSPAAWAMQPAGPGRWPPCDPRAARHRCSSGCFNDTSIAREVMYCGDWWNTDFFMNTTIKDLIGETQVNTERCKHLAEVLHVNVDWKINSISDGMRRRCQ